MDKSKIKLMTFMAIYDKKYGFEDKKITEYYRADYVYKRNCVSRIMITLAYLIILGFYACYIMFVNDEIFFNMDINVFIRNVAIVWFLIMVLYTIIGNVANRKKYDDANKRMNLYYAMMESLEKIDEN